MVNKEQEDACIFAPTSPYREYEEVEEILDEQDSMDRVRKVQSAIHAEEKKWKARYPFLNHYDNIVSAVVLSTLLIMLLMGYLFSMEFIPWYVASVVIGIILGVHHEIEHDIMHNMYFKNNPKMQDVVFWIVYVTKLYVPPWSRRIAHWKHHRVSGQLNDVEQRYLGTGESFSLKRFILAIHPLALYTKVKEMKDDAPQYDFQDVSEACVPSFTLWLVITKLWVVYYLSAYLNPSNPYTFLPEFLHPTVTYAMVLWIFPGLLRTSSHTFLNSTNHYYLDIPKKNIFYQCQVFDHPIFYPFALFTCDFGATHIIHHYNALQPFFVRQLCRNAAIEELKKQGARVNDWGVVLRKNAFHRDRKYAVREKMSFFLYTFLLIAMSPVWLLIGDLSFVSQFAMDKITRATKKAAEGSVEDDDNDNRLVVW